MKHSDALSPVAIYASVFGHNSDHSDGHSSPGDSILTKDAAGRAAGETNTDTEEGEDERGGASPDPNPNPDEEMEEKRSMIRIKTERIDDDDDEAPPFQFNRHSGLMNNAFFGAGGEFPSGVSVSEQQRMMAMAAAAVNSGQSVIPWMPMGMTHLNSGVSSAPGTASASMDDSMYTSPMDYGADGAYRGVSSSVSDLEAAKRLKIPNMRVLKDEPVPTGYTRYRFNEDCNYVHCGYREHQTHFHCMRKDCGYSFCDKTRFVQHTARHERLDTLMGGDFQQFRANVNCGRGDCAYANGATALANKASHFHCLKCEFVCTDTNKVVAHRRQHAKMDSINAAGFEKYTPTQNCNVDNCNHNQRQTHYHCLKCHYAVLGLSQMSSHKYRHMD